MAGRPASVADLAGIPHRSVATHAMIGGGRWISYPPLAEPSGERLSVGDPPRRTVGGITTTTYIDDLPMIATHTSRTMALRPYPLLGDSGSGILHKWVG